MWLSTHSNGCKNSFQPLFHLQPKPMVVITSCFGEMVQLILNKALSCAFTSSFTLE
jgi:hypothetical protein